MRKLTLLLIVSLLAAFSAAAQEYDVYLLIGQSNMAGRGEILPEDKEVIDGVWLLDADGNVVPAAVPCNIYSTIRKKISMQGFGLSNVFGQTLHARTGKKILLVVNARGGSKLDSWLKGAESHTFSAKEGDEKSLRGTPMPNFFDDAVRRCRQAMQYGRLKGILWHQGEGDSDSPLVDTYDKRLRRFASDLRKALKIGRKVPFVVGHVSPVFKNASAINQKLTKAAERIPNAFCVSARSCDTQKDSTHFSRAGYISLGTRYAEVILKEVYGQEMVYPEIK